jgi:tetrahydromethanopterin S-methyltransferase subunit H
MFHAGHRIVKDPAQGIFDRKKAEHLIRVQEDMSEKTGNPHMIDVVADTSNALQKYIAFISEITQVPFLINGPTASVRIQAASYAAEVGLAERTIYTSINYTASHEEVSALKEFGMKSAIIQAFNPKDITPKGMCSMLEGMGNKEGLLKMASNSGIQNILILAPVLEIPDIGTTARGIQLLKNRFGLPTGAAPLGVLRGWGWIKELGAYAENACRGVALALVQAAGANFLIYGSIEKAKSVFPACALIDAIVAYSAKRVGLKPLTENHPLYKIFRNRSSL